MPLLVNLQPAGKYLGEEYHRAGGVPAVVAELMRHGLIHEGALTVNGRTIGENCRGREAEDRDVIRSFENALMQDAGFIVLRGNLFDSAIMKTSVISQEFRERYLSNPNDPNAFEGRAIVFAEVELGLDLKRLDPSRLHIEGPRIEVALPPLEAQVQLMPGDTEIIGSNLNSEETAGLFEKAKEAFTREVMADPDLQAKARESSERAIKALLITLGFREVVFVKTPRPVAKTG